MRGGVVVELEPVYAVFLGLPSPIDRETASRWALEDSAAAFSGMIYGWTFEYEPGERARMIEEAVELSPLGAVPFGDERLRVTDVRSGDGILSVWSDYTLAPEQAYRMDAWKASNTVGVNATGTAPLQGAAGAKERRDIKFAALEDAVKKAIRAHLRLTNKNRPGSAAGRIALERFPEFAVADGRWTAHARFRLHVASVTPFAVH
ncbi:MAG: hypothetical protein LBS82_03160 [Spirochaetaceae bacterium]|nr:hypothetical protein [Spirochaetaceae bacterium]